MNKFIIGLAVLVLALFGLSACANVEEDYYVGKIVNKTQTEDWLSYTYEVELQLEDGSKIKREVSESEYLDLKLNSKYKVYYDSLFKTFEPIEETVENESNNENLQPE